MPNTDGSVVISTELDNKDLEKQLNSLTKKIEAVENRIQKNSAKKSVLDAKAASIKEAYRNAFNLGQDDLAKSLAHAWDGINKRSASLGEKISEDTADLERMKEEAGGVAKRLADASREGGVLGRATQAAADKMEAFAARVQKLAKRVFVFSLVTMGLRGLREWMGNVIQSNDAAAAALGRLKGALLTMAQPLLNVVIPAFITLVNILTRVVTVAAQAMAALFGTTMKAASDSAEALHGETEALKATGGAAKKASGSLAAFDKINKLSGDSGGGGGASGGIKPNFELGDEIAADRMRNILGLVEAIGAALLTWKISKAFGLNLKQSLGLFTAIFGAIQLLKGLFDAWVNGTSWSNLAQSLAGLALLAGGLYVAFGAVAAGVGLVVGGIALLITGIKDAVSNGWSLENLLMVISGILAAGVGIGLITGSWIPLLIGGIASVLLALAVATGHGKELVNGFKTVLTGFLNFFKGIFTGDIGLALDGIKTMCGGLCAVILALISGLQDALSSLLDWIDEKTNGRFHEIIETIKSFIGDACTVWREYVSSTIDAIQTILSGIIDFLFGVFTADWDRAWTGVKEILRGVINGIIGLFEGMVNMAIAGINLLIEALNAMIAKAASLFAAFGANITAPRVPAIPPVKIPRLAQGAIIPPNREFMAVLGDQRSGNNIETPEALLRKIVREESGSTGGDQTLILECDRVQFAKLIYKLNKAEGSRRGVSLAEV